MKKTSFNSKGVETVQFSFVCEECSHTIDTDKKSIFKNTFYADNKAVIPIIVSSERCSACDKEYTIKITTYEDNTTVEIEGLATSALITITDWTQDEKYIQDQIDTFLYDTDKMKVFRTEIEKLKQLLNITFDDSTVANTLYKQIYTGSITCMEDYLSTTLIQEVLNNKETFKVFVKTDKELSKRTLTFAQIYDTVDKLDILVKERLLGIQYHNIALVKSLYKIAFSYEMPDISEIAKIVNNRHDLVHRNGRDKEGVVVVIDKKTVSETLNTVENFIQQIDSVISLL